MIFPTLPWWFKQSVPSSRSKIVCQLPTNPEIWNLDWNVLHKQPLKNLPEILFQGDRCMGCREKDFDDYADILVCRNPTRCFELLFSTPTRSACVWLKLMILTCFELDGKPRLFLMRKTPWQDHLVRAWSTRTDEQDAEWWSWNSWPPSCVHLGHTGIALSLVQANLVWRAIHGYTCAPRITATNRGLRM